MTSDQQVGPRKVLNIHDICLAVIAIAIYCIDFIPLVMAVALRRQQQPPSGALHSKKILKTRKMNYIASFETRITKMLRYIYIQVFPCLVFILH